MKYLRDKLNGTDFFQTPRKSIILNNGFETYYH